MTLMIYFRNQHKTPKFLHTEPYMISFEKAPQKTKKGRKSISVNGLYMLTSIISNLILRRWKLHHTVTTLKNEDMNSHNWGPTSSLKQQNIVFRIFVHWLE